MILSRFAQHLELHWLLHYLNWHDEAQYGKLLAVQGTNWINKKISMLKCKLKFKLKTFFFARLINRNASLKILLKYQIDFGKSSLPSFTDSREPASFDVQANLYYARLQTYSGNIQQFNGFP